MEQPSQPWDYFPLLPLHAFTSLKKARKKVSEITGLRFEPKAASGTLTWYERDDGGFCVMYLRDNGMTTQQKYAVLAHECVHYAQNFAEFIGTELDRETEAYVVQAAMQACIDQIGEVWFETQSKPRTT